MLFDVRLFWESPRTGFRAVPWDEIREVDFLFNFLSPQIVPSDVLDRVKVQSINFHPAPPEYPGVGSASYAIYDQRESFGVTSHNMIPAVDAGSILRVLRFPIMQQDNCGTLWERALHYSLTLFYETLAEAARAGRAYKVSGEMWQGKSRTRSEFEGWMDQDTERKGQALSR